MRLLDGLTDALYFRGLGELGLLSSLPSAVVVLFAIVTQLADPWFVFSLLAVFYVWPVSGLRRRDTARLFALALLASALVLTLKVGIGVPRPPGSATATVPGWLPGALSEAYLRAAADGGFGFPSGHATGAVVLYGGLAAMIERHRRRYRIAIAGAIVVTVMISRLVLGLHFLVDVLAGGVLGAGVLWLGLRRGGPFQWFGLAAIVAGGGAVLAALQGHPAEAYDAAIGTGSAVGGAGGWSLVTRTEQSQRIAVRTLTGVLAVSAAAAAWALAYLFGASLPTLSGVDAMLTLLGSAVIAAVAIGLVIGLPAVLSRQDRYEERTWPRDDRADH